MYVVGNQSRFEVERRRIGEKEVTLITLPSFAGSGIAVMVNLRTLEALPVEFDTMDMEKGEMEVEEKKEEEEVIIDEDMANEENEWIVFSNSTVRFRIQRHERVCSAQFLAQSIVHGFGCSKSTLLDSLEGTRGATPYLLLSFLKQQKTFRRRQLERDRTANVLASERRKSTHASPVVINHSLNVPVPLNISG